MEGVYHLCNKSIAGFIIFNGNNEYERMLDGIRFYRHQKRPCRFSELGRSVAAPLPEVASPAGSVRILAYCLMPTHIHLLLQESEHGAASDFIGDLLNSYTRYFNVGHKRKGPLWQGRSKKVPVKTDEQLLHLTRYLHLNPVTAGLVKRPEDWRYSSYAEYAGLTPLRSGLADRSDLIDMDSRPYRKFVNDNISYQKELARIKKLTLE